MSNEAPKFCIQCGAKIDPNAVFCQACGAKISSSSQPQPQYTPTQNSTAYSDKNKVAAGVLAILLGGLGVHKFYLGQIGMGIIYILFCWTSIPSIIGLIEGILYLTSTDEQFQAKYVKN